MCECVHMRACVCACMCELQICMCICMNVYVCLCVLACVWACAHVCVGMYVCVFVCVCVHACAHSYDHRWRKKLSEDFMASWHYHVAWPSTLPRRNTSRSVLSLFCPLYTQVPHDTGEQVVQQVLKFLHSVY